MSKKDLRPAMPEYTYFDPDPVLYERSLRHNFHPRSPRIKEEKVQTQQHIASDSALLTASLGIMTKKPRHNQRSEPNSWRMAGGCLVHLTAIEFPSYLHILPKLMTRIFER